MIHLAVSFTRVALTAHILAVTVAFGPLCIYPVLTAAGRRADPTALMALHRLVLIAGYRRLAEQAPTTGAPSHVYRQRARRLNRAELTAAVLVLFTIFEMTTKPFA